MDMILSVILLTSPSHIDLNSGLVITCKLGGNPGAVPGRVSDEDLDLGLHPGGLVLFSTYHSEGPHPFTVQTHVLGEALGEQHVVALINEVSVGKCVLVHISGGEALVGQVEVGEALLVDQGR